MLDLLQTPAVAEAVQSALQVAHTGELSAEAIGAISLMAGTIARIVVPFLAQTDKVQRLLALLASAVALSLWCLSVGSFTREDLFSLAGAYLTVALATLGAFGLSDPKNYTRENLSALTNTVTLGMAGTPQPPKP